MTADALAAALAAAGLQIAVDPPALEGLTAFIALRAQWSRTHNLAGPRAKADPWRIDVVDSLAVTQVVTPDLPLVDVGAGSGTPGLIIAIARPDLAVRLVEPLTKRVAFLRTAVHRLGLRNVRIDRARWPVPLDAPCQVVSRAVVSPSDWPALAASGGAPVHAILRCLAAQRPAFTVDGFDAVDAVDYDLGEEGLRRVERWARASA